MIAGSLVPLGQLYFMGMEILFAFTGKKILNFQSSITILGFHCFSEWEFTNLSESILLWSQFQCYQQGILFGSDSWFSFLDRSFLSLPLLVLLGNNMLIDKLQN